MKYAIFTPKPLSDAILKMQAIQYGMPWEGRDVGNGIHVSSSLSKTERVHSLKQHPVDPNYAYPVDDSFIAYVKANSEALRVATGLNAAQMNSIISRLDAATELTPDWETPDT